MTDQPPTPLPQKVRDQIVARHATTERPWWREPGVWVAVVLLLALIISALLYTHAVQGQAHHAANDPCARDDQRVACRQAQAVVGSLANQANQQLTPHNLPPIPTPQIASGQPGPAGPQGAEGPAGPQGARGPAGASGSHGANGNPGSSGQPGPPGDTGSEGAQGPTGPAGPQGEQGPTGPEGAQGPAGPQGEPGPNGPAGPPCKDGYVLTEQPQLDGGSLEVCTSPPPTP